MFVVYNYRSDCAPNDAQIEPDGPVLDIPYISFDAFLHLPHLACFSAEPGNLGMPGDAWLVKVAHHIFVYQLPLTLCLAQHMWPWSHNTHVANQHIEELGQLINIRASHKITESKFPGVVGRSL